MKLTVSRKFLENFLFPQKKNCSNISINCTINSNVNTKNAYIRVNIACSNRLKQRFLKRLINASTRTIWKLTDSAISLPASMKLMDAHMQAYPLFLHLFRCDFRFSVNSSISLLQTFFAFYLTLHDWRLDISTVVALVAHFNLNLFRLTFLLFITFNNVNKCYTYFLN